MSQTIRILLWSGAMLAILLIAVTALAILRRRLFHGGGDPSGGPLSLHELRAMHQRGELDDAEYEQLRRAALAEWGVAPGGPSGRTENPGNVDDSG